MKLTNSQQKAVDLAKIGKNVFLSGSAGTGKSFTIESIKKELRYLDLTASTGIAAINIGGVTLHRWSGIKPGQETAKEVLEKMWWKKRLELERARAVLIDEVSMVSGSFFELLNDLLQTLRRNKLPFGGVQMIVVGDFLQLPPVGDQEQYCFETEAWQSSKFETIKLSKIFRQEKDTGFIDFLTNMRQGLLKDEDFKNFRDKCCKPREYEDYVRLYPTNRECDNLNYKKLNELPDPAYAYTAGTSGNDYEINWFFKNSLIQYRVDIKKDARVMMLSNTFIDLGVANGSTGTVLSAEDGKNALVKFDNGEEVLVKREHYPIKRRVDGEMVQVAKINQIPLRLSWGVTIHKAQGMSIEKVYCNFEKIFTDSQVYVALSRATDMEHLFVEHFHERKISFHPTALNFVND